MEEAKNFKEKNLMTAQKTMESLMFEKKKRENELELLKQSEPRLRKELQNIKENMARMRREMRVSDIAMPPVWVISMSHMTDNWRR